LSLVRGESLDWLPRLEAGADAFVLKRAIATALLLAIDAVQAGRRFVSPGGGDHAPNG
jgi:DNA-binding NarL/FixJ family response regulator